MAQNVKLPGQKSNPIEDIKAFFVGAPKAKWFPWAMIALIVVVLVVPLALAVPAFLPKPKADLQTLPSAAEADQGNAGANALPPISKDDREYIIAAAKDAGVQITDDSVVTVRYDKDNTHVILSVPAAGGGSFKVKTYRFEQSGDGSWQRK